MRNINLKQMLAANPALLDAFPAIREKVLNGSANQAITRQFHRRKVALNGNSKLIDSTVDKQAGVTSFDKGKLAGNEVMLITAVGMRYAYHASASETTPYGRRYTNNIYDILDVTADATDLDAGATGAQSQAVAAQIVHQNLLDASFKLNFAGKDKLVIPAGDFFVENTVNDKVRSAEDYFVSLDMAPILWVPNQDIQAELEFHPSLATASNSHFVELVLDGILIS